MKWLSNVPLINNYPTIKDAEVYYYIFSADKKILNIKNINKNHVCWVYLFVVGCPW